MESHSKVAGHALHQMLVNIPLAFLPASVGFDAMGLATKDDKWPQFAQTSIAIGVVGGAAAAVPGWIDWFAIPGKTRAKGIGLVHGLGNVAVLGLYAASYVMRRGETKKPKPLPIALGVVGMMIALATAWLGGELVDRLGVGVDDGAHLNAPNSLTHPTIEAADAPVVGAVSDVDDSKGVAVDTDAHMPAAEAE